MGLLLITVFVSVMLGACQGQECPRGWTFALGNCYRWYNGPERLNWYDAQDFCQVEASQDCGWPCNSNLVSIVSDEENSFLLDYWRTSREPVDPSLGQHYWIGFSEIGLTLIFEWSDGSPITYNNWDNGEPNDGSGEQFCGVMWKGVHNEDIGTWDDQPCTLEKPFICKYRL